MRADFSIVDERHVNLTSELLRLPAVVKRTGLSRSTIYRLMSGKQFPLPVRLSERAVGWRRSDLDQWSSTLPPAAH